MVARWAVPSRICLHGSLGLSKNVPSVGVGGSCGLVRGFTRWCLIRSLIGPCLLCGRTLPRGPHSADRDRGSANHLLPPGLSQAPTEAAQPGERFLDRLFWKKRFAENQGAFVWSASHASVLGLFSAAVGSVLGLRRVDAAHIDAISQGGKPCAGLLALADRRGFPLGPPFLFFCAIPPGPPFQGGKPRLRRGQVSFPGPSSQ